MQKLSEIIKLIVISIIFCYKLRLQNCSIKHCLFLNLADYSLRGSEKLIDLLL